MSGVTQCAGCFRRWLNAAGSRRGVLALSLLITALAHYSVRMKCHSPEKASSYKDRNLKRHLNLFSLSHHHHYSETVRLSWGSVRSLGRIIVILTDTSNLASLNRPRFQPTQWREGEGLPPLQLVPQFSNTQSDGTSWIPLVHCSADFSIELFQVAVTQLVHHPEYNSTLILRSDTIEETVSDFPSSVPILYGLKAIRTVHRRLLPRRPGRDSPLEQYCTLYGANDRVGTDPCVLVLTPIEISGSPLPYYHPRVAHIAFRFISTLGSGTLQIEVVPLPATPTDINSRLYRTSLALLGSLHRYGWGAMTNYKKRVLHDCIVPREEYQDLYLVMRERHKYLVSQWQEVTDPLKHVFEDIGIATFLILLWKDMYARGGAAPVHTEDLQSEPWKGWPRPPAGFVDIGCGNGLLTHILISEGYHGHGIDVRARTSWSSYPRQSQSHLHVEALDPTKLLDPNDTPTRYLQSGVFVIANHADELTPWVPVLSTLCSASGYLSIPCCSWTFDSKFERSTYSPYPTPEPLDSFTDTLNLGGDGSNSSSYSMYRIWLASLSLHCGWKIECENLRIPSTRNWALVGRERLDLSRNGKNNAELIVHVVKERGIFKTRRPEGKAGDH